jgi:hypothetical protein
MSSTTRREAWRIDFYSAAGQATRHADSRHEAEIIAAMLARLGMQKILVNLI